MKVATCAHLNAGGTKAAVRIVHWMRDEGRNPCVHCCAGGTKAAAHSSVCETKVVALEHIEHNALEHNESLIVGSELQSAPCGAPNLGAPPEQLM